MISKATAANWERLNTNPEGRLTKRANKRLSNKAFIPAEYVCNKENVSIIEDIVSLVRELDLDMGDAVYTLCIKQLTNNHLCDDNGFLAQHVTASLGDVNFSIVPELESINVPSDEFDFIGAVYQSLKTEGMKNQEGSYYTPTVVAREMTLGFSPTAERPILDPCCGTGAIFLGMEGVSDPHSFVGFDTDNLAVLICKTNLLCRYSDTEFVPRIECRDFLQLEESAFNPVSYIATNPPWGADCELPLFYETQIESKESSSFFLERALNLLDSDGLVSFLLPKAIMNISTHRDIRSLILKKTHIERVRYYSNIFTGVTTDLVNVVLRDGGKAKGETTVIRNGLKFKVDTAKFDSYADKTFRFLPEIDFLIQDKIFAIATSNLSSSTWALGVVTGNNKEKLYDEPISGSEPIYTGKEVRAYALSAPKKYIIFSPNELQQVAREDIYRTPEKLVYKFISKKLTFAIDETGSLCLNSANILIPRIEGMSVKTVAGFLNSVLYQYLYLTLFDDPKILKSNLCKLPFPALSSDQDALISNAVQSVLDGRSDSSEIDDLIFELFGFGEEEKRRVWEVVDGKA